MAKNGTLVQNLAEALANEFSKSDFFDLSDNDNFKEVTDLLYDILDKADKAEKAEKDKINKAEQDKKDIATKDDLYDLYQLITDYFDDIRNQLGDDKNKSNYKETKIKRNDYGVLSKGKGDKYYRGQNKETGSWDNISIRRNSETNEIEFYKIEGDESENENTNDYWEEENKEGNNEGENSENNEQNNESSEEESFSYSYDDELNDNGEKSKDNSSKEKDSRINQIRRDTYQILGDTLKIKRKLGIKEDKAEKKMSWLSKVFKKAEKKQEKRTEHLKLDLKRSIKQSAAKTWARFKKVLVAGVIFFLLPAITKLLKNTVKATESAWKPLAEWLHKNFPSMYESLKKIANAVSLLAEFIIDMKKLIDWYDENSTAINMAGMAGTLGVAGAKIGMMFGPIGAIIGGLLGAGIGALVGKWLSSDDEENPYEINEKQSKKYGAQIGRLERGVAITTAESSREEFVAADKAYKDLLRDAEAGKVSDAELETAAKKRIFAAYNYDIVRRGVLERSDLTNEQRSKIENQGTTDLGLATDLFDRSGNFNENAIKFTNGDNKIIMNVTNNNNTKVAQFIEESPAQ